MDDRLALGADEAAEASRLDSALDQLVDRAGHDSFPASDSPSWWAAPPTINVSD
jgi:hypothetical protein